MIYDKRVNVNNLNRNCAMALRDLEKLGFLETSCHRRKWAAFVSAAPAHLAASAHGHVQHWRHRLAPRLLEDGGRLGSVAYPGGKAIYFDIRKLDT